MSQNGNQTPVSTTPKVDSDMKYFKTPIHGLKVMVGDPDTKNGEIAPQYVRFNPFWVEMKGVQGRVKVGYLATKNGSALKKLEADANVTEIKKAEYDEATEYHEDESGVAYAGVRAPY